MPCTDQDDYAVEVKLPAHKKGDRWSGLSVGPVTVNGATPSGSLTRVRMRFLKRGSGETYTIDSDATASPDAPAVVDDAVNWEASIDSIDSFLTALGPWDWDMEFYESPHTVPKTYYKGAIMVLEDVA